MYFFCVCAGTTVNWWWIFPGFPPGFLRWHDGYWNTTISLICVENINNENSIDYVMYLGGVVVGLIQLRVPLFSYSHLVMNKLSNIFPKDIWYLMFYVLSFLTGRLAIFPFVCNQSFFPPLYCVGYLLDKLGLSISCIFPSKSVKSFKWTPGLHSCSLVLRFHLLFQILLSSFALWMHFINSWSLISNFNVCFKSHACYRFS